jgi:hypothetical protein
MKAIRTKVYQFSELNKTAQEKVINNCINDMIQYESADHYENWPEFKKAVDKAEQMQTPWFVGSYIYDYCGYDIISCLNGNTNCQYTKDGNFFNQ